MTYKNGVVITSAIVAFLLTALMASPAFAQTCYDQLKNLDCWGAGEDSGGGSSDHHKCNIKFKNLTSEGCCINGDQTAQPATIKVSARKADGSRAGGNTLSITAKSSKTLNLDKKKDFNSIRVVRLTKVTGYKRDTLECEDIKTILKGNGVCRVYVAGSRHMVSTAIKCDGGNIDTWK